MSAESKDEQEGKAIEISLTNTLPERSNGLEATAQAKSLVAFQRCTTLCQAFGQKLQGDKAAEAQVFSLKNDTHSTGAKLFDDAIARDGLSDHEIWPW